MSDKPFLYHRALLPGTYDPVTLGHMDIIRRAVSLAEEVWVGIFVNPDKKCMFTTEERLAFLRAACADLPTVRVVSDPGLVADFARRNGCDILIKGFRDQNDFSYEYRMARFNADRLVQTKLLPAAPALGHVSSTEVRRRLLAGEDLTEYLPASVIGLLSAR